MSNIFDVMKCMFKGDMPEENEIKSIPPYILAKYLSGDPRTLAFALLYNNYSKIPIECQFKAVRNSLYNKVKFIRFPKNDKIDDPKEIEYIAKYFKVNLERAREYRQLISQTELNDIINSFEKLNARNNVRK